MRCSLNIPCLWKKLGYIPRISGYACLTALLAAILFVAWVVTYSIMAMPRSNSHEDTSTTQLKDSVQWPAATVAAESDMSYGVVVDCGSSGSRVYVYYWLPHDGTPQQLLNIQQLMMQLTQGSKPVIKKIEPGISELADTPSQASEYIQPLLDFAAEHIPQDKHQATPLYILATGGMRMLAERDQEAILDDLRVDVPIKCDFLFSGTHVEVISGKQEGIYSWVAINYVLGKFDHELGDDPLVVVDVPTPERKTHVRKRTVGVIDMGGASLQIAYEVPQHIKFESKEDDAKNLMAEFNLGCSKNDLDHIYRIYVSTFLGFGANAARSRYEQWLLSN